MRQVVHWPSAKRLVYLDKSATPEFWDDRWRAEGKPGPVTYRDEVVTVTVCPLTVTLLASRFTLTDCRITLV